MRESGAELSRPSRGRTRAGRSGSRASAGPPARSSPLQSTPARYPASGAPPSRRRRTTQQRPAVDFARVVRTAESGHFPPCTAAASGAAACSTHAMHKKQDGDDGVGDLDRRTAAPPSLGAGTPKCVLRFHDRAGSGRVHASRRTGQPAGILHSHFGSFAARRGPQAGPRAPAPGQSNLQRPTARSGAASCTRQQRPLTDADDALRSRITDGDWPSRRRGRRASRPRVHFWARPGVMTGSLQHHDEPRRHRDHHHHRGGLARRTTAGTKSAPLAS